jgi:hypothetical protein
VATVGASEAQREDQAAAGGAGETAAGDSAGSGVSPPASRTERTS